MVRLIVTHSRLASHYQTHSGWATKAFLTVQGIALTCHVTQEDRQEENMRESKHVLCKKYTSVLFQDSSVNWIILGSAQSKENVPLLCFPVVLLMTNAGHNL